MRPVPAVAGSAVWLNHLVSPVSVVLDTHVNCTSSLVFHDLISNLPLVTVGAVATSIVVSATAIGKARVVLYQLSCVCVIDNILCS